MTRTTRRAEHTEPLPKPIPLTRWAEDFERQALILEGEAKLYRTIAKQLRKAGHGERQGRTLA